ncbi:hypothetical protein WJ50_19140 [Burkholderia ubonensis]|nr:hypothetical protein WJ49_18465 [Burkholderia ubonensis]KVL74348.1 hypothetical protein WJ48_04190 [Burkholderia ubonensis]KVL86546.1 hypothetical protein WJ50_19140 [Burkholderia ubonensis]
MLYESKRMKMPDIRIPQIGVAPPLHRLHERDVLIVFILVIQIRTVLPRCQAIFFFQPCAT